MNIMGLQGWGDFQTATPIEIKTFVLNCLLGAVQGTYSRATNFLNSAWVASVPAFTGSNTKLVSLDTTDASTVADAAQWTATHQMVNVAANIPPAMNKVVFLRAGSKWDNQVEINFGASACNNVSLGFRDNLATSGIFVNGATGGCPVFSFGSGITGANVLHISIAQPGIYSMVFVMQIAGNWNAFEMEWVVLP